MLLCVADQSSRRLSPLSHVLPFGGISGCYARGQEQLKLLVLIGNNEKKSKADSRESSLSVTQYFQLYLLLLQKSRVFILMIHYYSISWFTIIPIDSLILPYWSGCLQYFLPLLASFIWATALHTDSHLLLQSNKNLISRSALILNSS